MVPVQDELPTAPGRQRGVRPKIQLNQRIEAIYRQSKGQRREFLSLAARELDRSMSVQVSDLREHVLGHLRRIEAQVDTLATSLQQFYDCQQKHHRKIIQDAKGMADVEREEKAILCQWLNSFLRDLSTDPHLPPMDFTFARFALNVAMCAGQTDPETIVRTGTPAFLVGMLTSSNELVTGPAAMALSQIVLHDRCREAVALVGGVPPLVHLCHTCRSPAVLVQVCITLAQLAHFPSNKALLASKQGVAAMVQLVQAYGREDRVTKQVAGYALACLVNCTHQSDANRHLLAACGIAPAICGIIDVVDEEACLTQVCRMVANMAYNSPSTGLLLLNHEVDRSMAELVRCCDVIADSDVTEAAFIALSNLSSNTMNQTQAGSGLMPELVVNACRHCASPRVVRAAAMAVCSLAMLCQANKQRLAHFGAIEVLLDICMTWGLSPEPDTRYVPAGSSTGHEGSSRQRKEAELTATQMCIMALAMLIQHPSSHESWDQAQGLAKCLHICHNTEHNGCMEACALALVALIPEPESVLRTKRDELTLELESAGARLALVRCQEWVYGRTQSPQWLTFGIEILGMTQDALQRRCANAGVPFRCPDLCPRTSFFEEVCTTIPADIAVTTAPELQSMLFHVY